MDAQDARKPRPVLITGGTGFIGSYLALALAERGEDVILFDRNGTAAAAAPKMPRDGGARGWGG